MVLPLELLFFDAVLINNTVTLTWETGSEKNNDYFTIEKTTDFIHFYSAAKVKGAGNSTTKSTYAITDDNPLQGISYYSLKQTDYNGTFSYSDYQIVTFASSSEIKFEVYPNPCVNEPIKYSLKANKGDKIVIVVDDVTGRESYSKTISAEDASENIFSLDPSEKLAPGMYLISATSSESVNIIKLIIE